MIYKQCVLTIADNTATLDEDVYLYRLDKNVELYFTIVNNKYKFDKSDLNNIISMTNASYFQMRLYKDEKVKYTFAIQPTDKGKAKLTITNDLIDEPIEVGDYDFQISLLDADKSSMVSMPIAKQQIHVCEPLVTDASETGTAVLGLSTLETTGEIIDAFDENGNYIRKVHVNGEIISAELFNKWETALETNSKNITTLNSQYKDIVNNFKLVSGDNNTIKLMFGTKELSSVTINGGTVEPTPNTYTITNTLSNATNSNSDTSIEENTSYSANIAPNTGYKLKTVTVTMGGTDITSSAYSNGVINISNVTGNIVITVTTEVDTDAVVGDVDSNNNISLTGLSTGTYTLKYEDDSGTLSNYDTIATMEVE